MSMTERGLALAQMTKAVAFSAAVMGCVAPALRFDPSMRGRSIVVIVLAEMIVIPLVLACVGLLVLRQGPFRTWFVAATLFASVLQILVLFNAAEIVLLTFIRPWDSQTPS